MFSTNSPRANTQPAMPENIQVRRYLRGCAIAHQQQNIPTLASQPDRARLLKSVLRIGFF
ncbi:MAG TPA: hypothetical protein V6D12_16775 [Candidatus Obscuribacterales bacterium]